MTPPSVRQGAQVAALSLVIAAGAGLDARAQDPAPVVTGDGAPTTTDAAAPAETPAPAAGPVAAPPTTPTVPAGPAPAVTGLAAQPSSATARPAPAARGPERGRPRRPATEHAGPTGGQAAPSGREGARAADAVHGADLDLVTGRPVPRALIDAFRIPPFLLPIFQAAGVQYGVNWTVLAAINEIETDYGRNVATSTAGAEGWMQFLPSTWRTYGVDANGDGRRDPAEPVDAIFAAARYLRAAGFADDPAKAVFAYNHADWYVDSVLARARLLSALPATVVDALTGLTQGMMPAPGRVRYGRRGVDQATGGGATLRVAPGTPVLAVQSGRVIAIRRGPAGATVVLRDASGNTYVYRDLASVARRYPRLRDLPSVRDDRSGVPAVRRDPVPTGPATAGAPPATPRHDASPATPHDAGQERVRTPAVPSDAAAAGTPPFSPGTRATPGTSPLIAPGQAGFTTPMPPVTLSAVTVRRAGRADALRAAVAQGRLLQGERAELAHRARWRAAQHLDRSPRSLTAYLRGAVGLRARDVELHRLVPGSRVLAGTVLGHASRTTTPAGVAQLRFAVRPAGRRAPWIDPAPILDSWRLLRQATGRSARASGVLGPDALRPTVGQLLLLDRGQLARRILEDPRLTIYGCGRADIAAGAIDRRVLATLEFLTAHGLRIAVTSLRCGHGYLTASGNVSEHSSGDAVDIAAVDGVPILGHQGPGSITDRTIRLLLTLEGTMRPHQIISLMTYPGASNTLALPDHADHIHVGFRPAGSAAVDVGDGVAGEPLAPAVDRTTWRALSRRLGRIDNPRPGPATTR